MVIDPWPSLETAIVEGKNWISSPCAGPSAAIAVLSRKNAKAAAVITSNSKTADALKRSIVRMASPFRRTATCGNLYQLLFLNPVTDNSSNQYAHWSIWFWCNNFTDATHELVQ